MGGHRRQDNPVRIPESSGQALVAALQEGSGHGAWYDAMAPGLYQYCWTLVGPGGIGPEQDGPDGPALHGACAAVWASFTAAVERLDHLADPADFHVWMFALARAACRRQGMAETSPYAALPVASGERPAVEVLLRLPPSCRELLELSLRHNFAATGLARVLGLDAETAYQLGTAAVRRAVDTLNQADPGGAENRGWRVDDMAAAIGLLSPPLPPEGLRGLVVGDCTERNRAAARRSAVETMRPFDSEGFPLHRTLRPQTADGTEETTAAGAEGGPPEETDEYGTPSGADRVTTADISAHMRPEQLAELEASGPAGEAEQRSRRWTAPVIAGLLTVVVAVGIWSLGAFLGEGAPGGTVAEGPNRPPVSSPSAEAGDLLSTPTGDERRPQEETSGPGSEGPGTVEPDGTPGPAGDSGGAEGGTAPNGSGTSAPAREENASEGGGERAGGNGGGDTSAPESDSAPPASEPESTAPGDTGGSGETGEGDEDGGGGRGLVPSLLDGLRDLLVPKSSQENGDPS